MQRAASDALAAKVERIMEQKEEMVKKSAKEEEEEGEEGEEVEEAEAKGEAANGGGGGDKSGKEKGRRKIEQLTSDALAAASAASTALEPIDFGRRLAAERELSLLLLSSCSGAAGKEQQQQRKTLCRRRRRRQMSTTTAPSPVPQPAFDASGHFLAYGSLFGIKVVNLETNRLVRLLGKVESSERFLRLSLFQGGGGWGGGGAAAAAAGGGSRAAARAAALAAGDDDDDDGDDDEDEDDKSKAKKKKASASSFLLGDPTLAATAVGRSPFFPVHHPGARGPRGRRGQGGGGGLGRPLPWRGCRGRCRRGCRRFRRQGRVEREAAARGPDCARRRRWKAPSGDSDGEELALPGAPFSARRPGTSRCACSRSTPPRPSRTSPRTAGTATTTT